MPVLPFIKRGNSRHLLKLSLHDIEILKNAEYQINLLCYNRKIGDPLFIGHGNRSIKGAPLSSTFFTRTRNEVLMRVSASTGKNIRTHSSRVTRVSDMLESTDIRTVAQIMGHTSVTSTQVYDRVPADFEKTYKEMDRVREVDSSAIKEIGKERSSLYFENSSKS